MNARVFYLTIIVACLISCKQNSNQFDYSIIPVKSGEKWGYIDKEGKYLINPQFDNAYLFVNGMAKVLIDKKYGFISKDGKYQVNPLYKNASSFNEDISCVVVENGYPSYINKKGEVLFTVNNAEYCRNFHEGLAAVCIKDKWGFIDKKGKINIQPQFEEVSDFKNGYSVISQKCKEEVLKGFINGKGEVKINPQFKDAYPFSENLALVKLSDKWGFIDETGKIIINPQFEDAELFSEGLCVIKQGDSYGYIDKTGKIVINPQFKLAGPFKNKYAVVKSSDNKYGYINKDGKYEINPQFEQSGSFMDDLAFIKLGDKYGFIDKTGKIIINPQFEDIFGWYDYGYQIQSDYYDTDSFCDLFLLKSNNEQFRDVKKDLSLKNLIEDIHKGGNLTEESINSIKLTDALPIDEYSKITKIVYNFSGRIFSMAPQYSYSYYLGYYNTGNKKNYDFNAKVSGAEYTIELSGKAQNKQDIIIESLCSKLEKLLNTSSVKTNDDKVLECSTMKITLRKNSDCILSQVIVKVEFL
jgi:hypothetical protein